ncbi:hypothetical protein MAR_035127 [Mya arenaria]|uniref:Uncharacterized protein n=1 Tax=Mya arenaria TaxID=6604 RepID=A0ABY7EMM1_MYAAR|nr:hypothetical protein MAR_035127 [Mya arenaria]
MYQTIHLIFFLCDALKPLTTLTMIFEKNKIDLSTIKPRKDSTISDLTRLKEIEGPSTRKVVKLLADLDITPTEVQIGAVKAAEQEFIDNLIHHINIRLASSDIIDNMSVFNMDEKSAFYGDDEIMHLAEHFKMDVDKVLYEWDRLKDAVSTLDSEVVSGPVNLLKVFQKMKATTGDFGADVEKLCTTAAVIPVSTAEVERVFWPAPRRTCATDLKLSQYIIS